MSGIQLVCMPWLLLLPIYGNPSSSLAAWDGHDGALSQDERARRQVLLCHGMAPQLGRESQPPGQLPCGRLQRGQRHKLLALHMGRSSSGGSGGSSGLAAARAAEGSALVVSPACSPVVLPALAWDNSSTSNCCTQAGAGPTSVTLAR